MLLEALAPVEYKPSGYPTLFPPPTAASNRTTRVGIIILGTVYNTRLSGFSVPKNSTNIFKVYEHWQFQLSPPRLLLT